jgi:hypothetical protein
MVSTFAGTVGQFGSTDGTRGQPLTAQFYYPSSVATDSAGNVYVADTDNHTIRKITITQNGMATVSTLAGVPGQLGFADGPPGTAQFHYPYSLATDSTGNVYVADTYNYTIRKVTPAGIVSTVAGAAGQPGSTDGTPGLPLTARFYYPYGVATDSTDNVYVADTGARTIRKISLNSVTTVAGVPGTIGNVLGLLPGALDTPYSLAVLPGPGNRLVVADRNENAILEIAVP